MSFPRQILNQINEHTNGGCILAIINSENDFELYTNFDSPVMQRALVDFVLTRMDRIQEIQNIPWDDEIDKNFEEEEEEDENDY